MSESAKFVADLQATTLPALQQLGTTLGQEFLSGMQDVLSGAPAAAQTKVAELVRDGFKFKERALTATSHDEAREYAEAAEKVQRRIKTVLLAEGVVASQTTANLIGELFGKALDGLGTIATTLITTIAAGLAKGAISGLTGGEVDGFDPSSVFPFS